MSQVQSFGGIIYILKNNKPHFLVIKRQALSKKIEWTAPKGKAEVNESPVEAAKREIYEEAGLEKEKLEEQGLLGDFLISFPDTSFNKKVTYFLFKYNGNEKDVKISDTEGYLGVYNWLPIESVLNLIHYKGLRELYRKAYQILIDKKG